MGLAFLLTFAAGLATLIGGAIGISRHIHHAHIFAIMLAFAAGAMLGVSLLDLVPMAVASLTESYGAVYASMVTVAVVGLGALVVASIDRIIPCSNSVKTLQAKGTSLRCSDVLQQVEIRGRTKFGRTRLLRSGMLLAVIMALHNFPEGIITFTGAMYDTSLGITLAVAIALHNIPEGISIAAPIYRATRNKAKAIGYTALSALAEPLGAVFGYVLLRAALPAEMMGSIFAAVAGMMIYVSVSELIPAARYHSTHKVQPVLGVGLGAIVIMSSLVLMSNI
ncbi:zinc transporter ZupT [Candidatus Saccharibacteria bacterium]|nr:zinc transporter ZupT [Candidatus Saccharibacteria bacterium]